MTRVAVVGAGSLGRRHIEALTRMADDVALEIVDPSPSAIAEAAKLTENRQGTRLLNDIADLSPGVDVAIVATTAAPRLGIMTALLQRTKVPMVILEKFLFQAPAEYPEAARLLESTGTRAWVNCPRRVWPAYRDAASAFSDDRVAVRVTTSLRTAIGSNAVHFVDLLAMLNETVAVEIDAEFVELAPQAARRPGHVEFSGTLRGRTDNGAGFEFTTFVAEDGPLIVDLASPTRRMIIRESEQRAWVADTASEWKWSERPFQTQFQSRLTDLVVADLLESGFTELPTFTESSSLHLAVLHPLLDKYREAGHPEAQRCPIT